MHAGKTGGLRESPPNGDYRRAAYAVTSIVTATSLNSGFIQVISILLGDKSARGHPGARTEVEFVHTVLQGCRAAVANIRPQRWMIGRVTAAHSLPPRTDAEPEGRERSETHSGKRKRTRFLCASNPAKLVFLRGFLRLCFRGVCSASVTVSLRDAARPLVAARPRCVSDGRGTFRAFPHAVQLSLGLARDHSTPLTS